LSPQEIRYCLEMTDPRQLRPARGVGGEARLEEEDASNPPLGRRLYAAVGGGLGWTKRLGWADERWTEHLSRPGHETWILRVRGETAGYFELKRRPGASLEIAYLGLVPEFVGQGLGGYLLTTVVEIRYPKTVRVGG
jgi:GNAT superfamily N-acetyltransferase